MLCERHPTRWNGNERPCFAAKYLVSIRKKMERDIDLMERWNVKPAYKFELAASQGVRCPGDKKVG